jgi:large subunit ribosomal protein L6
MSRVGSNILKVQQGVHAERLDSGSLRLKGGKGEVTLSMPEAFEARLDGEEITVRPRDPGEKRSKKIASMHGTLVRQISIALKGVSEGFEKRLNLVGVGYKSELIEGGRVLKLSLGYSHDILYSIPEGITIVVEKPTTIKISGMSKQKVGQVVAEIKRYRPPEPYKGKGIQEPGQYIRRKEGKSK